MYRQSEKTVKRQYLLHMSPQYGELRHINGWDLLASLGHPSKFQRVSRLAFVTAATLLTRGQPNFAWCLAVSWAATLYIHFRGLLPLSEFCPVQNSLYVQVLRSRILAALLHGTPAAGVSQILRRGTRNWITKLSQTAPPILGRAAITLGIGPHASYYYYSMYFLPLALVFITTTTAMYSLGHVLHTVTAVPRSTEPSTLRGMVKWVSAFGLSNNKWRCGCG